ncbi:MAG: carbonic anhydrase [Parachlamydiaceae bacterium]
MKISKIIFLFCIIGWGSLCAEDPLQKLMDGNTRYVNSETICHTDWNVKRAALVQKQNPFAVIICCSDSRVPPELIFDQALGALFVVRIAGNVIDDLALGSVEYAVSNLKASLIMVLGHSNCGALSAALTETKFDNHIQDIMESLQPAVQAVKGESGDLLEKATKANVRFVISQLKCARPILAPLVLKDSLKIVGGFYKLDSGHVELVN